MGQGQPIAVVPTERLQIQIHPLFATLGAKKTPAGNQAALLLAESHSSSTAVEGHDHQASPDASLPAL